MFAIASKQSTLIKAVLRRGLHTSLPGLGSKKPPEQLLTLHGINKDRSEEIPLETSLRYLKSKAYTKTYGEDPVWTLYRRNHAGLFPPKKTRRTCIRAKTISTGNPCPICRDEYLVLHEENIDLLKQFICPHTGSILSYTETGLCQKSHEKLTVAVLRARDLGLIPFDVPFREYDYSHYQRK
ncbi:PREDICTED: 28S ribosomal protein S18b, mitochondrial [Nicrophorus vespilloides]|uniref:Small ribosomal subunit protein mS40 n=1 Tax=Nicrophorus vespilloides TaxID=110193 RepID=A0ABM1MC27_NICVS|nr:PREDICTED: 28S ribosomal protein S18b, mitochondrial [Nicrophorus vespilloides]